MRLPGVPPLRPQSLVVAAAADLSPYTGPWTRKQSAHLIRRIGFGAIKREVDGALNDGSAGKAVDRLLNTAAADPNPEPPAWYTRSGSTGIEQVYEVQRMWIDAMRQKGLIERMTLFWHNHLVTEYAGIQQRANNSIGHLMYGYYSLLRKHALGNFKTFIREISLNPAMLIYLDGFVNEKGHANENYGRELLELFTMGQYDTDGSLNYTEADIKEVARALTGWVVTSDNRASFILTRHDRGSKSFFGRTGAFDFYDVIDILFETRGLQIARYLSRKLYVFFLQAVPDEGIVEALAQEMLNQDFEIKPVLKVLLSSAHFYDDGFIGARVKSPLDFIIGFLREAEVIPTQALLEYIREALTPAQLGQELLNPPNVAGWPGLNPPDAGNSPGHYAWLTTTTLPQRWNLLANIILGSAGANYDPIEWVLKVSDPSDPFRLAPDLAQILIPTPLDVTGIRKVEEPFGGNPNVPPPPDVLNGPAYLRDLSKILLDGFPYYEWPFITDVDSEGVGDARNLLIEYLAYLVQLPAYQLT